MIDQTEPPSVAVSIRLPRANGGSDGPSRREPSRPASTRRFQRGDRVEVRSAGEILATLDERGELEGVPFMPEMVDFCGKPFTVGRRAEKICDTVNFLGSRRLLNTVVLEGNRCDGSGHGGCQAECVIFWKDAWLKPAEAAAAGDTSSAGSLDELRTLTVANASHEGPDGAPIYRCQATQALAASAPLSTGDPRQYVREVRVGNVPLPRFARVMARALVYQAGAKLGIMKKAPLRGPTSSSPRLPVVGLKPGQRVRVKSAAEIQETLTDKGRNRGLWFDREMLPFCGREFYIRGNVDRLINEGTGEMLELRDCVKLEGVVCSGELSNGRWFCPRDIYSYWREAWLEPVGPTPQG